MAIDGVKIIDSDDEYDIYNTIVERYKDGENIDTIVEDVLNDEKIWIYGRNTKKRNDYGIMLSDKLYVSYITNLPAVILFWNDYLHPSILSG